ncbi:hypothetical protein [Lactiplantibacillus argentoratensis]
MADITHGTWIKDGKAIDAVYQDGAKVYGRNLFLKSKVIANNYGTNGAYKQITVEPFDSTTNMWHVVSGKGNGGNVGLYWYGYANTKLPDTSDWSFSADVKGTGNIQKFGIELSSANPVVGTVGSEWSRVSQTGHFDNPKIKTIIMYFDTTNSPVDVYIKLPKLESGKIATACTPAPEDILK